MGTGNLSGSNWNDLVVSHLYQKTRFSSKRRNLNKKLAPQWIGRIFRPVCYRFDSKKEEKLKSNMCMNTGT
jgi:hypothetical protein